MSDSNGDDLLVRIPPRNPKRGYTARRAMFRGKRYEESHGWYELDPRYAAEMAELRQQGRRHDDARPLFQVVTRDEARKITKREGRAGTRVGAHPDEAHPHTPLRDEKPRPAMIDPDPDFDPRDDDEDEPPAGGLSAASKPKASKKKSSKKSGGGQRPRRPSSSPSEAEAKS